MESDGRRRLRTLHCMKCGSELVTRITTVKLEHIPIHLKDSPHNTIKRQVCEKAGCDWVFYNNPLPIVAAIIEHDDELGLESSNGIILVRGRGWPSSWFGLVTGFLESREDPLEGVLREVKEEVGLDGKVVSFIGVYPFPRLNQIILAYHIKCSGGKIILQEEEIEAYKKVPIKQLRPWAEGTGGAVRDFLIQQLGSSPPNSDTAFQRKNIKLDPTTGKFVERTSAEGQLQAKL